MAPTSREEAVDRAITSRLRHLYNLHAGEVDDRFTRHSIYVQFVDRMRYEKAIGRILDFKVATDVAGAFETYDFMVSWEHASGREHAWYLKM